MGGPDGDRHERGNIERSCGSSLCGEGREPRVIARRRTRSGRRRGEIKGSETARSTRSLVDGNAERRDLAGRNRGVFAQSLLGVVGDGAMIIYLSVCTRIDGCWVKVAYSLSSPDGLGGPDNTRSTGARRIMASEAMSCPPCSSVL